MIITEYADVLNFQIEVKYYPNQNNRWSANFVGAEAKEHKLSVGLLSEYGSGNSPEEAVEDYVEKIRGKVLVFSAYNKIKRREFDVPQDLEGKLLQRGRSSWGSE